MTSALKQLPRGFEDYKELCERNRYYVDKTTFIKKVFAEDDSKVLLITRPRRFGKTLTMSMFKYFLELNHEKPGDVSLQQSTKLFILHDLFVFKQALLQTHVVWVFMIKI